MKSKTRNLIPVVGILLGLLLPLPGAAAEGNALKNLTAAEMRAILAGFVAGLTEVSVELDGEPVEHLHRVRSRVFEVALPEENLFDAPCAFAGGFPAGIYSPAVDDGYYVLLNPLAAGQHTLRFHAENAEIGFVIDTTYELTVVPVSSK